MRRRTRRALAVLATLGAGALLLAGCGTDDSGTRPGGVPATSSPPAQRSGPEATSEPPPLIVEYGNQRLSLRPYTYCWSGNATPACADGMAPEPLPDLGTVSGDVTVRSAQDGWTFQASSEGTGGRCAEALPATVTAVDGRTWRISLAGPPGRYAVHLFSKGPDGDVAASFTVETTTGGPLPAPVASLTSFVERDGKPDAYSFDLSVSYLTVTPSRASARLTVTSADGRVSSYTLTPAKGDERAGACVTRGSVALSAPAPRGRVVEEIGRPPYALRVELDLDGTRYTATATWPNDVESSSSIPLRFNPPLPADR